VRRCGLLPAKVIEKGTSAVSWIRHTDFYDEAHTAPAESSKFQPQQDRDGAGSPAPTEEEIRSHYWPWWRRAAAYPVIMFIMAWRKLVSPLYGQVCSFYPSCSAYGLEAVTVHGLLRGSALTAWRVLRCNPFTGGGVNHVPPSQRVWPEEELPDIVKLNHPPIPRDPD
jgi:putative membrane protein insertion efficiency factor